MADAPNTPKVKTPKPLKGSKAEPVDMETAEKPVSSPVVLSPTAPPPTAHSKAPRRVKFLNKMSQALNVQAAVNGKLVHLSIRAKDAIELDHQDNYGPDVQAKLRARLLSIVDA